MRTYNQADIIKAAQIMSTIDDNDEVASVWSRQQIDMAAAMLRDIAAGMGNSRIICTGKTSIRTDIEQCD